jgi:tetraacyldisaccharide 4'-kinase
VSGVLLPLVPLYRAALGAKNLAYERGWAQQKRLRWPVVSIGNLSVGGSGKTPLTIRLAELLRERGVAVDVLSRGYGRRSPAVERVREVGSAEEFGDEPLLIARAAGVPVYVGASRYAAGLLAERQTPGTGLHLLDDGLQHRQLAREVDIVVLHDADFTTSLLPAGRLREGFSSLRRAHIVAMRAEDQELEPELRSRGWRGPVWWIERRLEVPPARRAVAFCAIGRPEEFFSGLRSEGIALATRCWRDHHRFTHADVGELMEMQRQHEGEAFLTTEKDLVRLTEEQRHRLEAAAPVQAVRLAVRLRDEAASLDRLWSLVTAAARNRGPRAEPAP